MLGIDDGRINVGENLKLVGDANVVAVRRNSVADDAFANLAVGERLDHLVIERHFANPAVWLNGHPRLLFLVAALVLREFFVRKLNDETASVWQGVAS